MFRLAAPFASVITTPSCLTEDFGPKHVSYPGYKALAFLHPDHYVPDPTIRDELGVGSDPYAIVRLTAMEAAHDHKEQGVPTPAVDKVIEVLAARGRVFLSCEGEIPPGYEGLAFSVPPQRMHDAMAFATVVIGDSGSMVGEAAVLGTPAVFCGKLAHRREYLPDLERRWGLVATYLPEEAEQSSRPSPRSWATQRAVRSGRTARPDARASRRCLRLVRRPPDVGHDVGAREHAGLRLAKRT